MHKKTSRITAFLVLTILIVFTFSMLSCDDTAESTSAETVQKTAIAEDTAPTTSETSAETEIETTEATETETTEETPETIPNGEITFQTEDGIELNGNIFGQGKKWVILSHMYPIDQEGWLEFAQDLEQEGYVAFTFNFRGYPKSGGNQDFDNMDKDLKAAISFVRQYDYEKIFLAGASMGGTVSIAVAVENDDISGVVSLSSAEKMSKNLDALSVVSELKMPKIFICAAGDLGNVEGTENLYDKAAEPKILEILENSKEHGTDIFSKEPEVAPILKDLIIDFLNSN